MNHELTTTTVRDIALKMPQTTRVFEEYKIDYCCGGRRPLSEACEIAGANTDEVLSKLNAMLETHESPEDSLETGTLSALITHILDTHHVYTRDELRNLEPLMEKVVRVHGDTHAGLKELGAAFVELKLDLLPHMEKEEVMLFPYIERLDRNRTAGIGGVIFAPFGTVKNPIRVMMNEHDVAGDILKRMRQLANDYTPPEDACPSYTALLHRLEELERDLHRHIHLENNVLFPRAVELEDALAAV